jgi:ADP-ribose pyrophosphatase YjhB (NUDIX family)
MPKTPSVGVGVIIEKNGQVLLLKRKKVNKGVKSALSSCSAFVTKPN